MLFPGGMLVLVLGLLLALASVSWSEDPLETLRVLALAPASGQAVVRWPDGRMLLVRVGATLGTTGVRLLQVLPDRLVLEDVTTDDAQRPTRQQVWLYKAPGDGGTSRQVRLHRALPASEQPVSEGYQAVFGPAQ